MTKIKKEKAMELLQKAIDAIPGLQKVPFSEEFTQWKRDTEVAIKHIFPSEEGHLNDFRGISYSPPPRMAAVAGRNIRPTPPRDVTPDYVQGLNRAGAILQSMVTEIETYWPDTPTVQEFDFWSLIHPEIVRVTRNRFESGEYADCAEAAFKHINALVKEEVKRKTGKEHDGSSLMKNAFSVNTPIITIDDISTETGKNIQQGYMEIFAGSMTGIRNPKAHLLIDISRERAIHFLFLASLLMDTLDMANNTYRYQK